MLEVDPNAPVVVADAVMFETGAPKSLTEDPTVWCYEHHGVDFTARDPGALSRFYEDLLVGRKMPPRMILRGLRGADSIVAAALFLYPRVRYLPETPRFVAAVDLAHRLGLPGLATIGSDSARFMRLLAAVTMSPCDQGTLRATTEWVVEYLESGRYPDLGSPFVSPRVLDSGPHGFVVAETTGDLLEGWVELFREGYERGVLFGPRTNTRMRVVVARKSVFCGLDFPRVLFRLNEMERAHGGTLDWTLMGDVLVSPSDGSRCLAAEIVRVVVGE